LQIAGRIAVRQQWLQLLISEWHWISSSNKPITRRSTTAEDRGIVTQFDATAAGAARR
jgi:hypothetical protein